MMALDPNDTMTCLKQLKIRGRGLLQTAWGMGKQGCQYFCVIATPERVLFATGSDRKVKELEDTSGAGMQVCMQLALACGWHLPAWLGLYRALRYREDDQIVSLLGRLTTRHLHACLHADYYAFMHLWLDCGYFLYATECIAAGQVVREVDAGCVITQLAMAAGSAPSLHADLGTHGSHVDISLLPNGCER